MVFLRQFSTFLLNVDMFILLGDVTYLITVVGLLLYMYRKESCTGISAKTQVLFCLLFMARHLDLFVNLTSPYSSLLSIACIAVSYITVLSIYFKYDDSYSSKHDTCRADILIVAAAVTAVFVNRDFTVVQIAWAFSQYLEALAIIPQLHLISKAGRAEKVVSYYIYGLTAYRTFYILNWAYRYSNEDFRDLVFIVPALFQIFIYCDYFFDLFSSRLIPKKRKYMHRIINVNYPTLLLDYDAVPGSPQKMNRVSKI